ncbi:hypothetical protein OC845_006600, partial [Tilletia horrida]
TVIDGSGPAYQPLTPPLPLGPNAAVGNPMHASFLAGLGTAANHGPSPDTPYPFHPVQAAAFPPSYYYRSPNPPLSGVAVHNLLTQRQTALSIVLHDDDNDELPFEPRARYRPARYHPCPGATSSSVKDAADGGRVEEDEDARAFRPLGPDVINSSSYTDRVFRGLSNYRPNRLQELCWPSAAFEHIDNHDRFHCQHCAAPWYKKAAGQTHLKESKRWLTTELVMVR